MQDLWLVILFHGGVGEHLYSSCIKRLAPICYIGLPKKQKAVQKIVKRETIFLKSWLRSPFS